MAKNNVNVVKGVRFTDKDGKKHLLNKEEFMRLMRRLNANAKRNHVIKVMEEAALE